ncbi:MAG: DNA gyrase modulator, partial [Draconibacterium sp.]|nr:DNA gyrase modulator [Draconibacterium sp.]
MKKYHVSDSPRRDFLKMGLKGGLVVATTPAILSSLTSCGPVEAARQSGFGIDPALLQKVIHKALEKGGDFADVYLENRISRQIVMEESKFKNGLYGISQGAGVRVISGNKTGYAYTDEITEEKLLRAAEVASYVARNSSVKTPVDINETERDSFITIEQPLGEIADSKRIEVIQRANDAAMSYNAAIKMASVDYYDEVRGRILANSEGVYLQDENPLMFFIVQTMSEKGNARHMSRERLSKHSGFEMFEKFTPE